eukprot:PhM_4_TR468/c1_g1_i2/m.80221
MEVGVEEAVHLARVLKLRLRDGHDDDLAGREPEGPLAAEVLRQDGDAALERAEDGAVDHDGARVAGLEGLLEGVRHDGAQAGRDRGLAARVIEHLGVARGRRGRGRGHELRGRAQQLLRLALHRLRDVREVEAEGQLEVELNRAALVLAVERVHDRDVDLGAVEGTVAGVEVPHALEGRAERLVSDEALDLLAGVHRAVVDEVVGGLVDGVGELRRDAAELIQSRQQLRLGHVPQGNVANVVLGARGQRQGEGEAEDVVDVLQERQGAADLGVHLLGRAEDVRVVLLEATHADQTGEGAADLVAVQHTEVSHAHRKLAVRAGAHVEHEAVPGAVHGLERELLLLDRRVEEVVLVLVVVTGDLPELRVVHVGRDDLLEAAAAVLAAHELRERVVDAGAVLEEERGAGRELVPRPELLVAADGAVVALGGLFHERLPLLEHLLLREGDAVHTLQRGVLRLAEEVRGRVARDGEALDAARVRQVGPAAGVDKVAAAVHRAVRALGDLAGEDRGLERVVAEHLERVVLRQAQALVRLLRLDQLHGAGLEHGVVELAHAATHVALVEEATVLERGADAEFAVECLLHGGAEHVGGAVPEHLARLGVVPVQELDGARRLERPREVPEHVVDLGDDDLVGEGVGDALGDLERRRGPRRGLHRLAVRERDRDGLGAGLVLLALLRIEAVEEVQAGLPELGLLELRELLRRDLGWCTGGGLLLGCVFGHGTTVRIRYYVVVQ